MTIGWPIAPSDISDSMANRPAPGDRQVIKSAVSLYSFSPAVVVHPTTEQEIIAAVQAAAQRNLPVRAIGALHSATPIPATEGICIVLDHYKKVVKIAGSLVTVQAGMKLWELNQVLAQQGLALPILGTIVQQTVAGAISTGTHGGSLHHPSLCGSVQSLRLIRADGSSLDLDRSHPLFNAVVISMGLLGIISTVTFQCVPAFSLQSEVCAMPMELFLQRFDAIQRTHQYVDMRYSPITDTVQLVLINPTAQPIRENGGWQQTVKTKQEWKRTDFINKLAQRLFNTHKFNWLQRWGFEQYDKTVYASPYGRSDFVLTHFDATSDELISNGTLDDLEPVADMELAVPYAQAVAALACLRDHFHKTRRYPSMHIHLRCTAADTFWLSPAYGQAVCWLEFWEYPRTGRFFAEMVEVLKPFHFRGHWGKQIPVESTYISQHYDKWQDFLTLRQNWDPDRRFANACLDRYFGQE
jgi:L-gulono-1,4-lactone dehydrogenase